MPTQAKETLASLQSWRSLDYPNECQFIQIHACSSRPHNLSRTLGSVENGLDESPRSAVEMRSGHGNGCAIVFGAAEMLREQGCEGGVG